jgi:hypothetical protein
MGLHVDFLNWIETQPIPDDPHMCTPRAWLTVFCADQNITLEKTQVRSILAGVASRVNPAATASHVYLVTDGHIIPGKSSSGKQPTWGGDIEPVTETAVVTYAPAAALNPLRALAVKDGFAYPASVSAIDGAIAAFDDAPKRLQRAAVEGITAMAAETELERVQRLNAEKIVQMQEGIIEDLRHDKRAWQDVVHRGNNRGQGGNPVVKA